MPFTYTYFSCTKKKEEEGIFVLRIQYIVGSGGVGHRYMVGNCVFPRESGYKV
jgi:hypothetical protein